MISDIKVDFSVIKKALHKEIEKKATLLTSDENTILNELLNNYQPKADIKDKHLYQYKKQFSDYYSDKCKKLSKYNSEKITNSDRQKINELENEGKIFISGVFIDLIRHLKLEQALLNIDNQIDIEILESLNAHLGNMFYLLWYSKFVTVPSNSV